MEETDTILGQISDLERITIKDDMLVDSNGRKAKILKFGQSYVYKVPTPIHGLTKEYLEYLGKIPIVYNKWANAVFVGIPYERDVGEDFIMLGGLIDSAYVSVQDFQIKK